MPLLKPPEIEFLIKHLQRQDIHTYEAFIRLKNSVTNLVQQLSPATGGFGAEFGAVIFNLAAGSVDLAVEDDVVPPRIWEKNADGIYASMVLEEWLSIAG